MKRRRALLGGSAALLAALTACSKQEEAAAPPAAAPGAGSPGDARQAWEAAAAGSGFTVGQAMAARTVRVFFDPQCPHCAALWMASKPLLDRIRMVWMPVAFISPSSGPQGALLLAAADPAAAMDLHETLLSSRQGGLVVPGPADPDLLAKIRANTDLWKRIDGRSVPYMVYRAGADGPYGSMSGGLPTAELARSLGL